MTAIGVVESGRADPAGRARPWPWTIDVGGAGQFFATKADAIAAVEDLQAKGVQSIDVGCLQVNLMHHPHAFPSLDAAFDPATNAAYGARFLRALFRITGNWTAAAADYHSQTAALGLPYARQVMLAWGHPELAPAAAPGPAAAGLGRLRAAGDGLCRAAARVGALWCLRAAGRDVRRLRPDRRQCGRPSAAAAGAGAAAGSARADRDRPGALLTGFQLIGRGQRRTDAFAHHRGQRFRVQRV